MGKGALVQRTLSGLVFLAVVIGCMLLATSAANAAAQSTADFFMMGGSELQYDLLGGEGVDGRRGSGGEVDLSNVCIRISTTPHDV